MEGSKKRADHAIDMASSMVAVPPRSRSAQEGNDASCAAPDFCPQRAVKERATTKQHMAEKVGLPELPAAGHVCTINSAQRC